MGNWRTDLLNRNQSNATVALSIPARKVVGSNPAFLIIFFIF